MKPFRNMKPFKGDETNAGVSLDVKCTIDLNPHFALLRSPVSACRINSRGESALRIRPIAQE